MRARRFKLQRKSGSRIASLAIAHVQCEPGVVKRTRKKKEAGFPPPLNTSFFSVAYGITIAAPLLSYQYSFNVAGKPVAPVVVILA